MYVCMYVSLSKFALREKKTHREGSLRNNIELWGLGQSKDNDTLFKVGYTLSLIS